MRSARTRRSATSVAVHQSNIHDQYICSMPQINPPFLVVETSCGSQMSNRKSNVFKLCQLRNPEPGFELTEQITSSITSYRTPHISTQLTRIVPQGKIFSCVVIKELRTQEACFSPWAEQDVLITMVKVKKCEGLKKSRRFLNTLSGCMSYVHATVGSTGDCDSEMEHTTTTTTTESNS